MPHQAAHYSVLKYGPPKRLAQQLRALFNETLEGENAGALLIIRNAMDGQQQLRFHLPVDVRPMGEMFALPIRCRVWTWDGEHYNPENYLVDILTIEIVPSGTSASEVTIVRKVEYDYWIYDNQQVHRTNLISYLSDKLRSILRNFLSVQASEGQTYGADRTDRSTDLSASASASPLARADTSQVIQPSQMPGSPTGAELSTTSVTRGAKEYGASHEEPWRPKAVSTHSPTSVGVSGSPPEEKEPWMLIPDHLWYRVAVEMWCKGHQGPEIASRLSLSSGTVYNRLAILRKQYPEAGIPYDKQRQNFDLLEE